MIDIPEGLLADQIYRLAGCSGRLKLDLTTGEVHLLDGSDLIMFRCRLMPEEDEIPW
jgi:hypothetical protein